MNRNDARMLLARTIRALFAYVPFMLAQGSIASLLPSWMQLPWTVLVVYYSATRITYITTDWLITRWAVDSRGITLQSGWPERSVVSTAWSDISAVDIRQSWIERLLRVYKVTATLGADGRSTLVLEAVTASQSKTISALHGQTSASLDPRPADGPEPGKVILRTRRRDFIPIGFTHGHFILIIPFALGTGLDLLQNLGIEWETMYEWFDRSGYAVALPVAGALALAYGSIHAMIQYSGYTVREHAWGYSTSGGLFQKRMREARHEHVVGFRVERNPLMLLTRTCSVRLILSTGRSENESLPLLPLIPDRKLGHYLDKLSLRLWPEQTMDRPMAEPILAFLSTLAGAAAVLSFLGPWAAGSVLLAGLVLANKLWVHLSRSAEAVWIDSGLVTRRLRVLDITAVRTLSYVSWVGPKPWSHGWLGLKVLDRRTRVHWIPRVPEELARSFVASRTGFPLGETPA